jgi:predicted ATPase
VAYQPFLSILRQYLNLAPTGELDRLDNFVLAALSRLVPASLPAARLDASPIPAGGEGERQLLFEGVDRVLCQCAAGGPTLVVLDDLHWADKVTALLMRHVVTGDEAAGLLIVGTYRESELSSSSPLASVLADLRRDRTGVRLALGGLSEADVATMVAARPSGASQAGQFAIALHEVTGGNPLFVEEILAHLEDTGTPGGVEQLQELTIPEGIRDVIDRRLARLGPSVRNTLTLGSVVGVEFDFWLLVAASGQPEEDVLGDLDEAVRARLIVEVPSTPGRYGFAHAVIRQTLYQPLTTLRRIRLHRRVGEALEHRPAVDLSRGGLRGSGSALRVGDRVARRAGRRGAGSPFRPDPGPGRGSLASR